MLVYYAIIFVFGLIIGSFLNVVIYRLGSGKKIVNDRSKCVHCGHVLAWNDLVPVFSFLALGGKCRYCKKKISWQYSTVEITTGMLFVLVLDYMFRINGLMDYKLISNLQFTIYNQFPISQIQITPYLLLSTLYYLAIASALIVIFVYDLKHYIIPDEIIYPAIIAAIGFSLFTDSTLYFILTQGLSSLNFFTQGGDIWTGLVKAFDFISYNSKFINHLFAAAVSFSFFFSIVFFTGGKGMGGGDVKLGFLMGFMLGWPMVFLAIFLSFIIGSFAGLILILLKKKEMKSMIPFGPFLVMGTFIALFWGEEILRWYWGMIN